MIKGEYDYLKELMKDNVCATCKGELLLVHHPTEAIWCLKCLDCGYPSALERVKSLTEEYRAGAELPEPIASNVRKSMARRHPQHDYRQGRGEIAGLTVTDLGTNALLSNEQVDQLIAFAERYHLDAFRGHVMLMYGKPYIGIDGYLYHAMVTRRPYNLRSRPLTVEEYQIFHLGDTDIGWLAELTLADTNQYFTGYGIVTYQEMTEKSKKDPEKLRSPVVAAHPWQLGQKRAEWQALRRAFPIGESDKE